MLQPQNVFLVYFTLIDSGHDGYELVGNDVMHKLEQGRSRLQQATKTHQLITVSRQNEPWLNDASGARGGLRRGCRRRVGKSSVYLS
jgi:hypothetical protein